MSVFIGSVGWGNYGSGSAAKRAFLAAGFISGSGYKGVRLSELKSHIVRQMGVRMDKAKMSNTIRKLLSQGYAFKQRPDYWDSVMYEHPKFAK
jgi:hypothetical protein